MEIQLFSEIRGRDQQQYVTTSFFFLDEGVRNFFAAVNGRDDDEEGAAGDDEAEFAVADVAVVVCGVDKYVIRRGKWATHRS